MSPTCDGTTAAAATISSLVPAVFGLVGVALGGLVTYMVGARQHRLELRLRRESMLVSLYGEVATIRNFLWMAAERCRAAMELGDPPEVSPLRIPREVFEAHAGDLGEIRDQQLVLDILHVYSVATASRDKAREILADASPNDIELYRYVNDLWAALGSATTHARTLAKAVSLFSSVSSPLEEVVSDEDCYRTATGLKDEAERFREKLRR